MTKIRDNRYTCAKEYCGYATPKFVVRFCGEWLGCFNTYIEAEQFMYIHKNSSKV